VPKIGPVPTPCNAIATMVENFYKLEQCGAGPLFVSSFYLCNKLRSCRQSNRKEVLISRERERSARSPKDRYMTLRYEYKYRNRIMVLNINTVTHFFSSYHTSKTRCRRCYHDRKTLAELLSSESAESIDTRHVTTIVDCDWSDVRLLMNVAAVHSPDVLALFNNA